MIDSKSEIQRRVSQTAYIRKLERIMGYRPELQRFTSPEIVSEFREKLDRQVNSAVVTKMVIPFVERLSNRFAALIAELERRNPNPIFIWIAGTNECGFADPIPLHEFRFGFEFECIPEGIISLVTTDASDRMLMDFEKDDKGMEIMTIELSGAGWGDAELKDLVALAPQAIV